MIIESYGAIQCAACCITSDPRTNFARACYQRISELVLSAVEQFLLANTDASMDSFEHSDNAVMFRY